MAKYLCQDGAYSSAPEDAGEDVFAASMLVRVWRKLGMNQQQCFEMLSLWLARHKITHFDGVIVVETTFKNAVEPFGCNDHIMAKHCVKHKCELFKEKVENNPHKIKTITDLYPKLEKEIQEDIYEVANFKTLFPIMNYPFYRGELVVFVGPEKSGKTSLIHNWFLSMANDPPEILNIHLEMRDTQEIIRLIQIMKNFKVNVSREIDEAAEFVKDGSERENIMESLKFIKFYNQSRNSKTILNLIEKNPFDIVYIDSFETISNDKGGVNETFGQKDLISKLQHLARIKNFLLIVTHHMNKMGDPNFITTNSIGGTKEISYQADHVIGLDLVPKEPLQRRLRNIVSRRHATLDYMLLGDPDTFRWKTLINAHLT